MKDKNIDLTLIKQLSAEAEELIIKAEALKNNAKDNSFHNEYVILLAKAAGLFMGISQESGMLIADLQNAVQDCYSKPKNNLADLLGSLSHLKGSSN